MADGDLQDGDTLVAAVSDFLDLWGDGALEISSGHGHDDEAAAKRSAAAVGSVLSRMGILSGHRPSSAHDPKRRDRLGKGQVIQCEPMPAVDAEGWSEWIRPLPGYLMQCCDCGLIHEMQFSARKVTEWIPPDRHVSDEIADPDVIVMMRARRHDGTDKADAE